MSAVSAVLVSKIWQKDAHCFVIEWSDGKIFQYRLSDLQNHCPCAGCTDDVTGKAHASKKTVDADVQAVRVVNAGRYGLRVQFTSGCSMGIYSFESLYNATYKVDGAPS